MHGDSRPKHPLQLKRRRYLLRLFLAFSSGALVFEGCVVIFVVVVVFEPFTAAIAYRRRLLHMVTAKRCVHPLAAVKR